MPMATRHDRRRPQHRHREEIERDERLRRLAFGEDERRGTAARWPRTRRRSRASPTRSRGRRISSANTSRHVHPSRVTIPRSVEPVLVTMLRAARPSRPPRARSRRARSAGSRRTPSATTQWSVMKPPRNGPMIDAKPNIAGEDRRHLRPLLHRVEVGGDRLRDREQAAGAHALEPRGTARAGSSTCAMPESAEPTRKMTMPARKMRLRPNMSASRPHSGMVAISASR